MRGLIMQWWDDLEGDSPAYGEDSADRVDVFTEDSEHIVTLCRAYAHGARWVDVDPADVVGKTLLWRDVETYLADPEGADLG